MKAICWRISVETPLVIFTVISVYRTIYLFSNIDEETLGVIFAYAFTLSPLSEENKKKRISDEE